MSDACSNPFKKCRQNHLTKKDINETKENEQEGTKEDINKDNEDIGKDKENKGGSGNTNTTEGKEEDPGPEDSAPAVVKAVVTEGRKPLRCQTNEKRGRTRTTSSKTDQASSSGPRPP